MKTKLVCLTLSILMLLSCLLTSCGDQKKEPTDTEQVDNSAKTITMWVVTNEETTPQAQKLVNEAFTKVTKSKFKTNVVIQFCTEDEYYEKLETAIKTTQADIELEEAHNKALRTFLRAEKKNQPGVSEEELRAQFYEKNPQYAKFQNVQNEDDEEQVVTEEETVVNDYGIVEIKYPDVKENQVDIFYIGSIGNESGEKKYMDYYERTFLNAVLGSQNPETGMSMYFQPMAAGYFKCYGTPFENFWCCTGTGMENFTKLNSAIYHAGEDSLYVNLYLASALPHLPL